MQCMNYSHLISGRCMETPAIWSHTQNFYLLSTLRQCLGDWVEGTRWEHSPEGVSWSELCLWAEGIWNASCPSRMKSQGQFLVLKNWGAAWYRDGFMAALEVVNLFYLGRLNCHGLLMSCFLLLTDRVMSYKLQNSSVLGPALGWSLGMSEPCSNHSGREAGSFCFSVSI